MGICAGQCCRLHRYYSPSSHLNFGCFPTKNPSFLLKRNKSGRMDLQGLVNISQYPVEDPTSSDFSKLVARCRETFVRDGIVTLPNFLTEEAVAAVVSEVEAAKGSAWFTDTEHNVFLDSGDDLFPQEHVRNRQMPTTVASLAYDCLDQKSPLLRLYHTESFTGSPTRSTTSSVPAPGTIGILTSLHSPSHLCFRPRSKVETSD